MRKLLDLQHPFFRPLWIRLAVTGVCLAWAGLELWGGNTGWALLFGVLGAFCAWEFFVAFNPREPDDKDGS